MHVVTVIPARYQSSRLPGKPLLRVQEKPIIQWVYEKALLSQEVSRVIVATDDERIAEAVRAFGGEVQLTSENHSTGSDRVAEVASKIDADIIVNLQGDEPLIDPESISQLVREMKQKNWEIGTLMAPFESEREISSSSVVKVISNSKSEAIFFTRYPYQFSNKHIGIYAFKKQTLLQFCKSTPCELEKVENLEQMRALYYGIVIGLVKVDHAHVGIDTIEDFELFKEKIEGTLK